MNPFFFWYLVARFSTIGVSKRLCSTVLPVLLCQRSVDVYVGLCLGFQFSSVSLIYLSILCTAPHCFFSPPLNNINCLWQCWIFIGLSGLSLVVAGRGCSWLQCEGFSLRWLLLLWSVGSRPRRLQRWQHLGSVAAAPWL